MSPRAASFNFPAAAAAASCAAGPFFLNCGHVGRDLFPGPSIRLLDELILEVIDANRAQVRAAKVEEFMASRWSRAGQPSHLGGTVQSGTSKNKSPAADIRNGRNRGNNLSPGWGSREGVARVTGD